MKIVLYASNFFALYFIDLSASWVPGTYGSDAFINSLFSDFDTKWLQLSIPLVRTEAQEKGVDKTQNYLSLLTVKYDHLQPILVQASPPILQHASCIAKDSLGNDDENLVTVLRIRVRDPVLFGPLDPDPGSRGQGTHIFESWNADPGDVNQNVNVLRARCSLWNWRLPLTQEHKWILWHLT
jgi:hypothetical protein